MIPSSSDSNSTSKKPHTEAFLSNTSDKTVSPKQLQDTLPTEDAKVFCDHTLNQQSVSVYETPQVLKPSEPLPEEASKNCDHRLLQQQEANIDDMKIPITDTSSQKPYVTKDDSETLLVLCQKAYENKTHESYLSIAEWFRRHEKNHSFLLQELKRQDDKECTPTHYIAGLNPTWALIKQIIDLYPGTLKTFDKTGRIPLHWASKREAKPEVLNLFLDQFPESRDSKDQYGMSPLDYAPDNSYLKDLLRGPDFPDPFKSSTKERHQVFIVNKTSRRLKISYRETEDNNTISEDGTIEPDETVPFEVKGTNSKGLIFDFWLFDNAKYGWKLNVFVKKGYCQVIRGQPREMIQHATKENAFDSVISSKEKRQHLVTPFQSQRETSQGSDELLILCREAYSNPTKKTHNRIKDWIWKHEENRQYLKDALHQWDNDRRTPTHYLAGSKAPLNLVERFVDLAPQNLKEQDAAGRLPLHWAAKNNASKNVVNFLIDQHPESLLVTDDYNMSPLNHVPENSYLIDLLRGPDLPDPIKNKNKNDGQVIYIVNRTGRRLKVGYRKALRSTYKWGINAAGFGIIIERTPRSESNTSTKTTIDPNATCKLPVTCRGLKFDFWCESKEGFGWRTNVFVPKGFTQVIRGQPHNLK